MATRSKKKLTDYLELAALLITLVAFAGITAAGFLMTCEVEIDWASENIERVLFLSDNVAVNLIVYAVALCLTGLLLRADVKKGTLWIVISGMAFTTLIAGLWWVKNAHALPDADSDTLTELARQVTAGDWADIAPSYYLRTFPFQMGYLMFLEGFSRAFGVENILRVQELNVVFLTLSNLALVRTSHLLFQNRKVTLLTALLLLLFIQPIFLTTFVYGNIPGMFFSFLAILLFIEAQRGRKLCYIGMCVSMALAVTLKMNYSIIMIALAIVLFLSALRNRKALPAIAAAAMVVLTLFVSGLPQKSYERRAGVSFGAGTPQGAWLVTGFRESSLCSGWYNGYTTTILLKNGYDQEATRAAVKADFEERFEIFKSRPRYALAFFGKKLISQWQVPSYQCIWSSEVGKHSAPLPEAVASIYEGRTGEVLDTYFNHLMQFIYAGFVIGLIALMKKRNLPALALSLVLLGACLYHLLFEAKAQYVATYIPLMLPIAAAGLVSLNALITAAGEKRAQARKK